MRERERDDMGPCAMAGRSGGASSGRGAEVACGAPGNGTSLAVRGSGRMSGLERELIEGWGVRAVGCSDAEMLA